MIYRCANVLCGARFRIPWPSGTCKNCAAPLLLVEDDINPEEELRMAVDDILSGITELLSNVPNSRTS